MGVGEKKPQKAVGLVRQTSGKKGADPSGSALQKEKKDRIAPATSAMNVRGQETSAAPLTGPRGGVGTSPSAG